MEFPLNGNVGSRVEREECLTDTPSTLPDNSTSGTSVMVEGACQYEPWMVVTRKKGGYKGTKHIPSSVGFTKSAEKVNQFSSKGMQANYTKDGPTSPLPRNGPQTQ